MLLAHSYCEGKNCSKRDICKWHVGPFTKSTPLIPYIDNSYSSGITSYNDETGTTKYVVDYWCGDRSDNYSLFEEITSNNPLTYLLYKPGSTLYRAYQGNIIKCEVKRINISELGISYSVEDEDGFTYVINSEDIDNKEEWFNYLPNSN